MFGLIVVIVSEMYFVGEDASGVSLLKSPDTYLSCLLELLRFDFSI